MLLLLGPFSILLCKAHIWLYKSTEKSRLLWTRTQYWFFCGAVKHLHSIWLLSETLFNSWSQIALFTARVLVKRTISILTIHYSNGTLPHKLVTWWMPFCWTWKPILKLFFLFIFFTMRFLNKMKYSFLLLSYWNFYWNELKTLTEKKKEEEKNDCTA